MFDPAITPPYADTATPSNPFELARTAPLLRVVPRADPPHGTPPQATYVLAIPVDLEDLIERAIAARTGARSLNVPRQRVRFAGFELDLLERRLVSPGGGTEQLPGLEFVLLKTLAGSPHRPVARATLAAIMSRSATTRLTGRTVDSYVSRVRARLRRGGTATLIATVPRIGYQLDADVDRS